MPGAVEAVELGCEPVVSGEVALEALALVEAVDWFGNWADVLAVAVVSGSVGCGVVVAVEGDELVLVLP